MYCVCFRLQTAPLASAVQEDSQVAPRVDGAHLHHGAIRPPAGARALQLPAAVPGRAAAGQPRRHRLAVVQHGASLHHQRPLWIPPAVLPQPRGARLPPSQVSHGHPAPTHTAHRKRTL